MWQTIKWMALLALVLLLVLLWFGPWLFEIVFGAPWRPAGELARALSPYIAMHFVASPLAVVTMAWQAQRWAFRMAVVRLVAFIGALAIGLNSNGLMGAAWAISVAMVPYFGWYFWQLAHWLAAIKTGGKQ